MMTQHSRGTPDNSNRHIGQYELLQTLGSGGFAKVYHGKHLILETEAAVKVLHTALMYEQAEQFEIEARTIANLKHPNIVRILDFDVENSIPFLVMEFAPHGSLRELYPVGKRAPLDMVVSYVKQVARALQFAHTRGVIHRDVKPENLLLGERGEVLLTDFGIAIGQQALDAQTIDNVVGTLPYMAPEQINGQPCEASDQYALAIVAYELLTGTLPYNGTGWEIIHQHLTAQPSSLCANAPMIPPEVDDVVMQALSKDPQKRYTNISKFASALEKASKRVPPTSGNISRSHTVQLTNKRRTPLTLSLLVALFLIISGSIWGIVTSIAHEATVTITPSTQDMTHDYNLLAVEGKVDYNQHQVYSRSISSTTTSESKTMSATGAGETSGFQAKGALTFYNGLVTPQTIDAGTIFANASEVQVVTDVSTVIPPANPPYLGSVTVTAHALQVGISGNIEANSINQPCCISDKSITVRNLSAFSGGQDPQPYTYIKQSDITSAVASLENALKPTAQILLQKQVRSNEMLVSSFQCMPKVNSDHAANEKAIKVKVSVMLTCNGWAFDQDKAHSLTATLLREDVFKRLGRDYTLAGNVVTTLLKVMFKNVNQGINFLLVKAEGLWIYRYSNAQKRVLVKLIAGKSQEDARTLLLKQPGVTQVDIETPWWVLWIIRDSLPENVDHITLNIATIKSNKG